MANMIINRKSLLLLQKSSSFMEEVLNGGRVRVSYHSSTSRRSNSPSTVDLKKLRPMILKRIEERANDYPVKGMLNVAREVLTARTALYDGVSTLIHHFPVWACKYR